MKLKKKKRSVCPKCRTVQLLEAHHIYPQKYYGSGIDNPFTILLCSNCHKDIGELVHNAPKMSIEQYAIIMWLFLKDRPINI